MLSRILTVLCLSSVAFLSFAAAGETVVRPVELGVSSVDSRMVALRTSAFGAVGVAVVAGFVFWRKGRRRRKLIPSMAAGGTHAAMTAAGPIQANGKALTPQPKFSSQPKLRLSPGGPKERGSASPAPNGKNHGNRRNGHSQVNGKRRKIFNYHKFYTEMVLQVSPATRADSYDAFPIEVNGYARQNQQHQTETRPTNGTNGTNGSANGGHSEMISNQQTLIADQKRLIDEQTRLIEEKTRLIAEKNEVLLRQTELFNNNVL